MLAALTPAEVNTHVLIAVAVIIVGARFGGWAISKIGQPRVHGEILAGILLGPSLLGVVWPDAIDYLFPTQVISALKVLAMIGLVLFMFLIGLELDISKLRGQGSKAVTISAASIVAPMGLGALLGVWLYPRLGAGVDKLAFCLFLGAAMAITAFPVLARVLQETGLYHTRIGVLTITVAAVDDVSAWCILAVVVAVTNATGFGDALRILALSLVFFISMIAIVKPLLARRHTIPVWMAIGIAMLSAWLTEQIEIHAIFGAFVAGAVMPRKPKIQHEIHEKLQTATLAFLLPVFFMVVGLATRVDLLGSAYLLGITVLVIGVAIAGKWGGAMAAAKGTGESWQDAAAIGVLVNTRGLTELVILSVGLELGVITTTIFTIMVLMALVTTLMATPMLALISPIYHRGMTAKDVHTEDELSVELEDQHVRNGKHVPAPPAPEGATPNGETKAKRSTR